MKTYYTKKSYTKATCTRKYFFSAYILSTKLDYTLRRSALPSHFTDEETESQNPRPKPHSLEVLETRFEPNSASTQRLFFLYINCEGKAENRTQLGCV